MNREMDVRKTLSNEAGSCNACTAHITEKGSVPHWVWVVRLRMCEFRVCEDCLEALLRQLKS